MPLKNFRSYSNSKSFNEGPFNYLSLDIVLWFDKKIVCVQRSSAGLCYVGISIGGVFCEWKAF